MSTPLLLLHGALGSKSQFTSLIKRLETEIEVHVLDFEGHGSSTSPSGYSMDRFTQNVLDYLDNNDLLKANIFGYSMGGYVALHTALKVPHRIERVMTLGTKFEWSPESASRETRMLDPDKIETKVPEFAAILNRIHTGSDWKSVVRRTAQLMLDLGNGTGHLGNNLSHIQIPVLISVGDQDRMVTKEESQSSANHLMNGSFKLLEGAEHQIERIDMDLMALSITQFLE